MQPRCSRDHHESRRAELEEELKQPRCSRGAIGLVCAPQALPEVYKRVTFVAGEVGKDLIGNYEFGDRWPSSGLLTIWSFLMRETPVEVRWLHFGTRPGWRLELT